jgi:O-acetyl-ADP-ribose deacetylase (regulator of RNase III)
VELRASLVDITTLEVDAIVNAANSALVPGGGVDGAINRAAGPDLGATMLALHGCPTGEARITPGFRLKAKHVIHALGPVWEGGQRGEPRLLANAYRSALALAKENSLKTVAFPAISTGVYGYPLDPAAQIAVETVREFGKAPGSVQAVIFACFSNEALQAYSKLGVPIVSKLQ